MEDYKKKYEEALERASHIKDYNTVATPQEVAELLFPELKESEDERIRKILIEQVERWHECALKNNVVQDIKDLAGAIAWLEKQGKQKPAWSEEDEVMLDEIIDFFENGTVKLQHDLSLYASWLKSLKERIE